MAKIIGGLGTSHVPSIGAALDKGLRDTPDWKPFFDGYEAGKQWMREARPDIAVVVFNDHGNSFFLDRVPTFAVGVAESYRPVDEGWGPRAIPAFEGAVDFSWHFVDRLVERTGNGERLKSHLMASHTLAADVGRIASTARVGRLVLHHLIPADDPEFGEAHWHEALRASWDGPLTVGRDGLVIPIDQKAKAPEDARA